MFMAALKNLGTVEQQAEWVPKAVRCSIIGTYAQTEMGHGTFIRGLETTAIFDVKRKEFVIHSPTITAYKVRESALVCDEVPTKYLFSGGQADLVIPRTMLLFSLSSTRRGNGVEFIPLSSNLEIWKATNQ